MCDMFGHQQHLSHCAKSVLPAETLVTVDPAGYDHSSTDSSTGTDNSSSVSNGEEEDHANLTKVTQTSAFTQRIMVEVCPIFPANV